MEVVEGPLVRDVEGRQAFDVVAEEVESDRLVALRRPQVDDAATHGELCAVLDQALPAISHVDERREEEVTVELHAPSHLDRFEGHLGREYLRNGAGGRHDHVRGTTLRNSPAQERPRRHRLTVGAHAFEGVRVPTGPQRYLVIGSQ